MAAVRTGTALPWRTVATGVPWAAVGMPWTAGRRLPSAAVPCSLSTSSTWSAGERGDQREAGGGEGVPCWGSESTSAGEGGRGREREEEGSDREEEKEKAEGKERERQSGRRVRAVRGMRDEEGAAAGRLARVEAAAAAALDALAFEELRLPLVEEEGLYLRSLGAQSDVVAKELFAWQDGRLRVALRPEATAGVLRHCLAPAAAAAAHPRLQERRIRYVGPMFRRERPQRGRHRQFTQVGAEWISPALPCPVPDALLATALHRTLASLGIAHEFRINSLGTAEERAAHAVALTAFLEPRAAALSEESRARLARGAVLRVLDSKHPADLAALADGAPSLSAFLGSRSRAELDLWQALLDEAAVPTRRDAALVRGLDYYSGPVFEVLPLQAAPSAAAVGDAAAAAESATLAQAALAGGGRYDGLAAALGGLPRLALGWALGVERVAALLPLPPSTRPLVLACLAPAAPEAGERAKRPKKAKLGERKEGERRGREEREEGEEGTAAQVAVAARLAARLSAPPGPGVRPLPPLRLLRASSARRALEQALAEDALACVLVGAQEAAAAAATVRLLDARRQETVALGDVAPLLHRWLGGGEGSAEAEAGGDEGAP